MRGPLAVRISDGVVTRNVTARTRDLRFTKTAQGGDVDLSCRLIVPRNTFADLGPGDRVEVFDSRTGQAVWSGNTDNPGTTASAQGELYDLQAFGAAVRLQAATTPLGYVVTSVDHFDRSSNSVKRARTRVDERSDGTPTLLVDTGSDEDKNFNFRGIVDKASDLPSTGNTKNDLFIVDASDQGRFWDGNSWNDAGAAIKTSWQGEWITRSFKRAGLTISRIRADIDAGTDNNSWRFQIRAGEDMDLLRLVDDKGATTTASTLGAYRGSGEGLVGADIAGFRVARTDSRVIPTDSHWFEFWNPVLRQTMLGRRGTVADGGYDRNHVFAHEVIADMLGRGMFADVDPELVTIPTTTYPIDALDWLDGISMGDALQQLVAFEPGLWWKAAGDTFQSGFYSDAEPRYVISKRHGGITSPGEEFALCNRVAVSWTDRRGKEQTTVVRRSVEGLDYTRDAEPITLPEGLGSEANARRVGEKVLDEAADPPRAGTAVIRQRIRDQWQGCDVLPHEVEPGCRVMEQETGDVLRLTQVEYVDSDGTAVLTLGEPSLTADQRVNRIARRQRRRRRRR